MLSILANRTYRHLFLAQIIALVGTGLATVALGLLAEHSAGANAGAVLGTAMAIKMIAYIGVAPVVGAYANRLPRRAFLIAMDVICCNRRRPVSRRPSRPRSPTCCRRRKTIHGRYRSRASLTTWRA